MKTNTFNYFRNAFAIVGFFIIACSVGTADDTTVEAEPPVQSNIGKYQVADAEGGGGSYSFYVINTENGQVKWFRRNSGSDNFSLASTTNTQ